MGDKLLHEMENYYLEEIGRLKESLEMVKEDRDTYKAYCEFDKDMLEKTSKENKRLEAFVNSWKQLYEQQRKLTNDYAQAVSILHCRIEEMEIVAESNCGNTHKEE